MKMFSAIMFLLSSKLYKPPPAADDTVINTDVTVIAADTKVAEPVTSKNAQDADNGHFTESQI